MVNSSAEHKKILLTGGSGNLGRAIIRSGYFPNLIYPPIEEMDITSEKSIADFFEKNSFDAVIHAAAMVDMAEAEQNPAKAVDVNIVGTSNLVRAVIREEQNHNKKLRFIYISTDGVYAGEKGDYSEKDATIPYNIYGWTKLGGECVVHGLSNFCIIRTSFFNPQNVKHEFYATDKYSSRVPIDYLPKAIKFLIENDFVGVINVGGKKESDYEKYKKIKPDIKPCAYEDLAQKSPMKISRDASMNTIFWENLTKGVKNLSARGGSASGG